MFNVLLLGFLRVQSHLIVGDPASAVAEARTYHEQHCEDPAGYQWLIKSLAAAGAETEMMEVWHRFHAHFSEKAEERELLEAMCWGILQKGRRASGMGTRVIALLGAALTQDVYAVPVLLEGMRHSNSQLRALSVKLGGLYGDGALREEIVRLFHEERVWDVRKATLEAVAHLKLVDLLPELIATISNSRVGVEEREVAVKAAVLLRDHVELEELHSLASHERSSLRLLACECVAHLMDQALVEPILPLVTDAHPDVRAAALKAIGLVKAPLSHEVFHAAQSRDPLVRMTAGWLLHIHGEPKGAEVLLRGLRDEKPEIRTLAAGAILTSGRYGVPLAKQELESATDPYVRANLALALLGQREEVARASEELDHFLATHHEQIMWGEGFFTPLQRSILAHQPAIPNYPEAINQTVRLELLGLLAAVEYPNVQEAMKKFLKEKRWGVTGLAAETLLGEGNESALALVRELLEDPDKEVRTEAALVLATWGRDHSAIPTLLEVYPKGDRMMKIKILESLGRIGAAEAVPFLIERLQEPSHTLRMIASCVLIQTLNH